MRLLIVLCVFVACVHAQDEEGKGASASSTDVHVGCFASESTVRLTDGQEKRIDALRTGEQVLAVEQRQVQTSEMFLILDRESSKSVTFYTLRTASGHQISLTGLHLLPVVSSHPDERFTAARDIQLGERLYVLLDGQLQVSPIVNITIETKRGFVAPLTLAGTMLVNDIYASCYASVRNHRLAQSFMAPFRWYYRLAKLMSFGDPFAAHSSDGIHWLLKPIYQLVCFLRPSSLQLA